MTVRITGSLLTASAAALLSAQQPQPQEVRIERSAETHVMIRSADGIAAPPMATAIRADVMSVMPFEAGFGVKSMLNAPYSAEAVTEFKQQLADGNRITRRSSDAIYRDSEGRTRKEQTVSSVGPWATGAGKIINIWDPTTGTNLLLDPNTKTATKTVVKFDTISDGRVPPDVVRMRTPGGPGGPGISVGTAMVGGVTGPGPGPGAHTMVFESRVAEPARRVEGPGPQKMSSKREDLGKKMFDGVEAQGTRTIDTIEAGAMGNEKEIQVISERWFSTELGVLLMSRHSDPRMGETTYTLTNIRRAEPSRDLFEAPADFKVNEHSNMRWFEKVEKIEKKQ